MNDRTSGHRAQLKLWRRELGLDGLPVFPFLGRAGENLAGAWEDFRSWCM
jgi:hypothetical protein